MFIHKNQQPNGQYERDKCFACLRKLGFGAKVIGKLHGLKKTTVEKLFSVKGRIPEPRYEGFDKEWRNYRAAKSKASRELNLERNGCFPETRAYFKEECKAELKRQEDYDNMYYCYHKKGFFGKRTNCPRWRRKKRLRAIVRNAWMGLSSDSLCLTHLGCTASVFTKYIEDQMEDGWTRENYATVWNFDHIRPCAEFDVFDLDQVKILNHYTNIRPMCIIENAKLGALLQNKSSFLLSQSIE